MTDSLFRPGSKKLPDDVIEVFDAICAAARHPHRLAVMSVKTANGKKTHYVIAVMQEDGSYAVPIAVIPSDVSVAEYLKHYDQMLTVAGGAEADPEFKGVRQ